MVQLTQTSPLHLAGVLAFASKPATTPIKLRPASADLTSLGEASAFVDASGNILVAWSKATSLAHEHFDSAWELNPYIKNPFNQVHITPAGLWYSTTARVGTQTPQTYLKNFGALMAP